MTTKKVEAMLQLRRNGYGYRELGSLFGVSRQRAHQICTARNINPVGRPPKRTYVYPNIIDWLISNGRNNTWLAEQVGLSQSMLYKIMRGESQPKKPFIDAVVKATGLPYEVAFSREVSDGEL